MILYNRLYTLQCGGNYIWAPSFLLSVSLDSDEHQQYSCYKRGGKQFLAWNATAANNKEEISSVFAQQLVFTLKSCFEDKKNQDSRDTMFEQLYELRSTNVRV